MQSKVGVHQAQIEKIFQDRREFLFQIIPISKFISTSVQAKAAANEISIPNGRGLFPSVIAACSIVITRWGTSILAQPIVKETEIKTRSNGANYSDAICGNNLLHLRADSHWRTYFDCINYHGSLYKSFEDRAAFQTEVSDMYGWREPDKHKAVLSAKDRRAQVKAFASTKKDPVRFFKKVESTIKTYCLEALDS